MLGHEGTILAAHWPAYDPALTVTDEVEIAVQVMGKLRGSVRVARDAPEESVHALALASESITRHLAGKQIIRVIYVPNRLINFVAK